MSTVICFRESVLPPFMPRDGQNRIYAPFMTVYLVISLLKHRIYTVYVWFRPTLFILHAGRNWALKR